MDVSGDWAVTLTFLMGEAQHAFRLQQAGDQIEGRYRTQYGEQEIRGRIEDDGTVHLRSGVHHEACGAGYGFRGRLEGDVLEGEVGLGEFWTARWRAERQG